MKQSIWKFTPTQILILFFVLLSAYTLYRFGYKSTLPDRFIPRDFSVFHNAPERWLNGEVVYQPEDPSPFKYSPTVLLLFAGTIHLFSKPTAWMLWCLVSMLGFSLSLFWFWKWALPLNNWSLSRFCFVLAASVLFGWHGFIEHFSYGQVDMLLFSAFIGSVYFLENPLRLPRWLSLAKAGFLFSLCLLTKPTSGILLLYPLFIRRFDALVSTAVATLALFLLPVLVWGWDQHLALLSQWKDCIQIQQTTEFLTGNLNQGLAAVIARLTGQQSQMMFLYKAILVVTGVLTVVFLPRVWTKKLNIHQKPLLVSLTILIYLLVTPLSWRWLTFAWLPIGFVLFGYSMEAISVRAPQSILIKSLVMGFFIIGILLQKAVAGFLGIHEVDVLSFYGLYCWGTFILLLLNFVLLSQRFWPTYESKF